jgi:hypothetical protein
MTHAAHTQQFHPHSHAGQRRLASGLNFLVAIYLIISGWVDGITSGNTANAIILGIVVAILAATRFSGATRPWASWVDAIIGVWLIISPWVYGFAGQSFMWNYIIVGIIMVVLGVWSATASETSGTTTTQP